MISFEHWKDGFVMTIEGRRVLRHSSASPAIFLGIPDKKTAESQAAKSGKFTWQSLGVPRVVNEGPEFTVLDFGSACTIRLFYGERVLHIGFSSSSAKPGGVKMRFGALPGEMLFGAGPSAGYDMKGRKVALSPGGSDEALRQEPSVMSNSGTWIHVDGEGSTDWDFRGSITELSCSTMPKEIALGFGKTVAAGMELLTRHKAGKRARLPDWMQAGPIFEEKERGFRIEAAVDGEESRFIGGEEWERNLFAASARALPLPAAGMKSAAGLVSTILSLSFSGYGQIFIRDGLELAAFGPLFVASALPDRQDEAKDHRLAASAAIYATLKPYREYCSAEWVEKGITALVHPALLYPDEAALWKFCDQYLYGSDILIAPTPEGGQGPRRLYLPDDEWIHIWTSRRYRGGVTIVDAPEGKPAIFYRSRSAFATLFDALRLKATRL